MWSLFGRRRRVQVDGQTTVDCREPFPGFAVLDFETTGFSWERGDRVIEIGLVQLDRKAEPTGAWTTLIDPCRPVAGTEVHQITDRDVLHAPRFAEVADLVVASCADRVLVAHNLGFDAGFLRNELARAGIDVELGGDTGLCTMRMAEHYLPHVSSSLEDLCFAAGIAVEYRHWALWDAEATGKLLRYYLNGDPAFAERWCWPIQRGLAVEWPSPPEGETRLLPRCMPTAGHPSDDWCVPELRPVERPPLPGRPRRR